LTSVVLPKPAGAEMRVSLRRRPALNRSNRRGRRIAFGAGGRIYSLVARIGVDIDQAQSFYPIFKYLRKLSQPTSAYKYASGPTKLHQRPLTTYYLVAPVVAVASGVDVGVTVGVEVVCSVGV